MPLDLSAYRDRNPFERVFCPLRDFRRIATRYDKRADIFFSAINDRRGAHLVDRN
jgi:putative transposase